MRFCVGGLKKVSVLLIFLCFNSTCYSQDYERDTGPVVPSYAQGEKVMKEVRADKNYQHGETQDLERTLPNSAKTPQSGYSGNSGSSSAYNDQIPEREFPEENESDSGGLKLTWIVLGTCLFGGLLIYLFFSDLRSVFYSSGPKAVIGSSPQAGVHEHISLMPLEERLRHAQANEDYRLAVRLQYLILLRELNESGHIVWRMDKTNSEYVRELRSSPLRQKFSGVTWVFNNVWYGHKPVSKSDYQEFCREMNQLSVVTM